MKRFLLIAGLMTALPLPGWAAGASADGPHSRVTLAAETLSARPGDEIWLGLLFKMEKDWHIYWKNPGDSGQAPEVRWTLPSGFSAGATQWPFPRRLELPPLTNFGYEDRVLLPVRLMVPADAKTGLFPIEASLDWLICKVECLPAAGTVKISLPVSLEKPRPDPRYQEAFARAKASLPGDFPGWRLRAEAEKGAVALTVAPPGKASVAQPEFFPEDGLAFEHAAPQGRVQNNGDWRLTLRLSDQADAAPKRLRGIIVSQSRAMNVDVPIAAAAGAPLARALALAFLGGLLLNLMPCVFPVLSIKVLGFLQTPESQRRKQALLYALGILLTFWALAGTLLALRAGGEKIGWGFQLQSPPFVALMAGLLFTLGLNLLGVFEAGVSLTRLGGLTAKVQGPWGSLASGALAVVVATPCTAPFMGAALASALLRPPQEALLIFTALALGLALPYVLLSWHPAFLRLLPRPGAWMETLKAALAFPLLASAVWLVWVFSRQCGPDATAGLLSGLLVLGFGVWIYGRSSSSFGRAAGLSLALLGLAAGAFSGRFGSSPTAAAGLWEPYSADRLAELRGQGRPVFIDFTAAWCVTCQVNKRLVLTKEDVLAEFKARNVALLRADWTSRDPAITEALAALGASGVPVYALYTEKDKPATLLPTLLTRAGVKAELEKLDRFIVK